MEINIISVVAMFVVAIITGFTIGYDRRNMRATMLEFRISRFRSLLKSINNEFNVNTIRYQTMPFIQKIQDEIQIVLKEDEVL